jgi:uncharacterized protein YggE
MMHSYYRNYYPHVQYQPYRNTQPNTITVEGVGQLSVQPDQANITLGIVTENLSVQTAQQENATISNNVIQAIKQLGIEEEAIKTTVYSIRPRYDYVEGVSILKGYVVEHQLEVTVDDLSVVGKVYDTAIQNGANRSGSIQFLVSNPNPYYQEALTKAVQNAKEKAGVIANSIGVTLISTPLIIEEQMEQPETFFPKFSVQAESLAAQAVPPIQSGEYVIKAKVKAKFTFSS